MIYGFLRWNSGLSETTTAGKLSGYNFLLASGRGVQLIHVYDVDREFDVIETRALLLSWRYAWLNNLYSGEFDMIETLDDHSASIFTTKFACNSSKPLSCSAKKFVVACKYYNTRFWLQEYMLSPRSCIYAYRARKLAFSVGQVISENLFIKCFIGCLLYYHNEYVFKSILFRIERMC